MDSSFFLNPLHSMQKKYEALRASYTENINDRDIAKRFGFTYYSFKSIKRDYKNATADDFFFVVKKGPKGHHQTTIDSKNRVIELRKKNYSIPEIEEKLYSENIIISCVTKLIQCPGNQSITIFTTSQIFSNFRFFDIAIIRSIFPIAKIVITEPITKQ